MVIDTEQLEDGSQLKAGVVIIGGGMAGIALGRQLADSGLDVAILESGGESPDARVTDLSAGTMTVGSGREDAQRNDEYLTVSRVRCLGGAGNVWGGKCGPLDPIDFKKRSWVPYSGWPVDRDTLEPYYDRACALLELPTFRRPSPSNWPEPIFDKKTPAFAPRTRAYTKYTGALKGGPFQAYKDAATTHPRIKVYLRANVTRIALRPDGRRVESLVVRTLNGRTHTARGDRYVLATGGIENVRLLLASNDVVPGGIGSHSDWLGRGFQGHSTVFADPTTISIMRSESALAAYNISQQNAPHTVLGLSDAHQADRRRLNFTMTLAGNPSKPLPAAAAIKAVAAKLAGAPAGIHKAVYFMIEHPPNRDSRIILAGDQRDALGMPRVRLDMRHDESEFETLERSIATIAQELGRCGLGRIQWSGARKEWLASMKSLSRHHMGATRMATSPADGVVNEHGTVHGVNNLYVAGSSVFPTSGLTNPTLTLLALAYRMGDRLISSNGATQ